MIKGSDWYRSAGVVDPVEARVVRGTWSAPRPGDTVDWGEGDARAWKRVTADENGWMSDPDLRGGYAYIAIDAAEETVMLLEGMAHRMVYVNGEPRAGNLYQYKETWEPWEPHFDYSLVPILLKPGNNDLLFQGGRVPRLKVRLHAPRSEVLFNVNDATLPDLLAGEAVDTWGSVVVINATTEPVDDLFVVSSIAGGEEVATPLPRLLPLSIRKVGFKLQGGAPVETGRTALSLALVQQRGDAAHAYDRQDLALQAKHTQDNQKRTFISQIDGSVQYYGLNPAREADAVDAPALFLSVHGAAVEAINQSGSYRAKAWGHLVAPTNRRPYGFNWEDWGRLDALEVLDIALETLRVDPSRVYLTGHSMGGHGTWHLGALYPDRFAAIGPSAGWISFWSYRPRQALEQTTPIDQMLMRATLPSHTFDLAENYRQLGVYIIHGADDDNVPADQSRQMVARLESFHKDFVYHEEPDAGHWWDKSDEDGADCVDWYPLFDFFARHARPGKERVRHVDFRTPSPGVSACNNWLCVEAQTEPLKMSTVDVRVDPGKRRFAGTTDNVARLVLDLSLLSPGEPLAVMLDGQSMEQIAYPAASGRLWLHRRQGQWTVGEPAPRAHKGPHRYGTFKDAFRNHVVFVYGTRGSEEENAWAFAKARFDAEQFWYQGNGSIEVVRDVDFDAASEPDRNVVLYGNAETNAVWPMLLGESPVQVRRGEMRIGEEHVAGAEIGSLLIRPRPGSDVASVAAVTGTGLTGMRLTDQRPYLNPGFAYPDLVVFSASLLERGNNAVRAAGFFGLDWSVEDGTFVRAE